MKKYFAILLIVLIGLLVSLSLSGCHKPVPVTSQETAENKTVWMPDRNLRQAVREALKLAPGASLTPQELARLTKLVLINLGKSHSAQQKISSLKGLEHATGLEVLRLYRHQVKDITPLTDLTKLEWLVLYDNEISDITPLASLTGLKKLDLDSNKIKDITPLLRLTGLEELDLSSNQVVDIKGLPSLTGLKKLHLSWNRNITDFTPLTALTGLEVLSLSRNRIKDLTLLSRLTGLTRLVISGNEITDLTPLEKLTGLTQLNLWDNEITDLTPLEKLTGLTQVNLSGNEITDLTPLEKLTGLTELVLGSNQVVDINGLSSLTNLKNLELWDNEITDLTPLANLTGLTQLNLSGNKITDLTPLANLTGLTKLELNSNQVVDITPLANLTGLTKLELKDNPIQDVTPLYILRDRNPNLRIEMPLPESDLIPDANLAEAVREALGLAPGHPFSREDLQGLRRLTLIFFPRKEITDLTGLEHATSLKELFISNNKISDLTPLADLTELWQLEIWDNEISDLTPLANLKNLGHLNLAGNKISDLTPLANLKVLWELDLSHNEISDITPLANLNGLEALELNDTKINEIAHSPPPPFVNLNGLRNLYLSHNKISALTPLANLKALWELDLSHNEITDITPLANLKVLHWLNLENNQIRDVSALTQLTNFDWLKARSTTNLGTLRIQSNPIQDITPLQTLFKSNQNMRIDVGFKGKFLYPVMYWIDMENGTLHRCIGDTVVNLLPDIQNATRLALDPYYYYSYYCYYWTEKTDANTWRVRQASKYTTTAQITDFREELTDIPMDMAIAENLLYVLVASGKIQRFRASSSNFEPDFITGLASPKHLVADVLDEKLYWTEKTTDGIWQIRCAAFDGSNVQSVKILPSMPLGLGIDAIAKQLYVSVPEGKIQRLRVDGSDFQPDFITGLVSPGSLDVDVGDSKVYWTEKDGIWRASLNGENIESVVTGLGRPAHLVLDVRLPIATETQ